MTQPQPLEGEPKLQVIGAGWGRTGTNSLKMALEKLLDGPCYHMFECVKRPGFQKWIDAYAGKPDWKGIFTHPDGDKFYKATVDYPACGMYRQLMEAYPDAKVLLTVRDPEKWYDSAIETIWSWRCGEQNPAHRIFEYFRKFQEQARAIQGSIWVTCHVLNPLRKYNVEIGMHVFWTWAPFFWTCTCFLDLARFFLTWGTKHVGDMPVCFLDPVCFFLGTCMYLCWTQGFFFRQP